MEKTWALNSRNETGTPTLRTPTLPSHAEKEPGFLLATSLLSQYAYTIKQHPHYLSSKKLPTMLRNIRRTNFYGVCTHTVKPGSDKHPARRWRYLETRRRHARRLKREISTPPLPRRGHQGGCIVGSHRPRDRNRKSRQRSGVTYPSHNPHLTPPPGGWHHCGHKLVTWAGKSAREVLKNQDERQWNGR